MPPTLSRFALQEVTLKATTPPRASSEASLPHQLSMPRGLLEGAGQGRVGPVFPLLMVCSP